MKGLGKVFFTDDLETHALSDIELEVQRGEYICVAGPSGCGKSTLLSIMGLLDSPTEGSYWLNGRPLENLSLWERARIRSGGQQQRVAVARALVGQPTILLADEPTGNLDSNNGQSVMELLRDLYQGGATICIVTHDLRYAEYAERTIQLFDGQIVNGTDSQETEREKDRKTLISEVTGDDLTLDSDGGGIDNPKNRKNQLIRH
jgi:putative ABC transport system ATP-binding protein